MKTKNLLILVVLLWLTGCASSPNDSSMLNSGNGGGVTTTTLQPGNGTPAHCNHFSGPSNLVGKAKSYFDAYGNYDSRWIRVRFSDLPAGFASSDTLFIQFYRWRVSPAGVVEQDPTPMSFRLEDPSTGAIASGWFGADKGFNRSAFFAITGDQNASKLMNYNFLIAGTDMSLGYQVVRTTLRSSDGGGSTVALADMLIPNYEANPNVYGASHNGTLNQIHPFWSRRTEGWTSANYLAFAQEFCF